MTSMVVDPIDGAEMIRQLLVYDHMSTGDYFGRLEFRLDVSDCDVETAAAAIDELNAVHDGVDAYIGGDNVIDFDYYITADLLPVFRAITARYYSRHGARLLRWCYSAGS